MQHQVRFNTNCLTTRRMFDPSCLKTRTISRNLKPRKGGLYACTAPPYYL
jgi:hypothetical protein